jgi:hypothetical protein
MHIFIRTFSVDLLLLFAVFVLTIESCCTKLAPPLFLSLSLSQTLYALSIQSAIYNGDEKDFRVDLGIDLLNQSHHAFRTNKDSIFPFESFSRIEHKQISTEAE